MPGRMSDGDGNGLLPAGWEYHVLYRIMSHHDWQGLFPAVSCQGTDYVVFGEILYLLPDMLRQSHWTVTLRKNAPSGTAGIVSFLTVKSGPTGRASP